MLKNCAYITSDMDNKDKGTVAGVEIKYRPRIKKPKGFGARHVQTLALFFAMTVGYTIRAHLGVTLVAMTSQSNKGTKISNNSKITNTTSEDPNEIDLKNSTLNLNNTAEDIKIIDSEVYITDFTVYRSYNWKKSKQELILFSFFVGYTSMQIPMGIISQKFGGKIPVVVGLILNGLLSIITPWAALGGGWIGICCCRILQGMSQATFYPSIHCMLGKWAPLCERGQLSSYIYTGSQLGTVIAFQISGVLAGSEMFRWPATFWVLGVCSLLCSGLVIWLVAPSPDTYPNISKEEIEYIMQDSGSSGSKKLKTPWRSILTSKAMWGVVATHTGSSIGYLFILTEIPVYMSRVLNVNIKDNGLYSSLPYMFMYGMGLLCGWFSDWIIKNSYMTVANVRKAFNTVGMLVSAIFLIGFSFVSSTVVAVVLLVFCIGLHSGVHSGFNINYIDLAPNFAGPMISIGNMFGHLCSSLFVPTLISNIIKDDLSNPVKWRIVIATIAALMIITNTIYVFTARGSIQPWNYGEEKELDCEKPGQEELTLMNGNKESK